MKNKAVLIKDVVDEFLNEFTPEKLSTQTKIMHYWPSIIPKNALEHTHPLLIKNKTLVVLVSNSAWLYRLTLEKDSLLKKIRSYTKETTITNIRFKIKSR
ncbi:MAG: DUF721 domain-containing protein [Candidatus Omnitrophota bacterium]